MTWHLLLTFGRKPARAKECASGRAPLWCCLACLLASAPALSGDLDRLAERLAQLRAEVDRLQQQIEQRKTEHRQKLDALGAQLAQLEAEKRRHQLALEKLRSELQAAGAKANPAQSSDEALKPVLERGIASLRAYIRASLPFKTEERLHALDALEAKLQAHTVSLNKLSNELWALFEDELRLSRENGLYQQLIPLEGGSALVEVAKLGMAMLYFQTPDGRYGLARPQGDSWQFEIVHQEDDRTRIAQLMDSLRKQVRQGYFELPNPGLKQ